VRRPGFAFGGLLRLAFGLLGVRDLQQVLRGFGELGRVQPGRGVEEELLALLTQVDPVGEPVDRVHDHRCLLG
jgi:hypothetical protein